MSWRDENSNMRSLASCILRWNVPLFWLVCFIALIKIAAAAAVFDDAYITFRVVDNFTHGYGLRWNIDERVQLYTHPLWVLLHIPLHLLIDNFYIASILLSAVCGGIGIWLLATMADTSRWHKAVLVIVPLFLSKTFNAYINCGLENPLSFFLLVWFAREWLRPHYRCHRLCAIAALCVLTRFDNGLLVLPALLYGLWERRKEVRPLSLLAAVSPLLIWCAFSLFYYGFVLPNTKYAKTDTGIPASSIILQGLKYTYNFFYYDTLSFLLIAGGIASSLVAYRRQVSLSTVDGRMALLGAGMALGFVYVVAVGGDYMCGRFFTGMLALALVLLFQAFHRCEARALWVILALMLGAQVINDKIITPLTPNIMDFRVDFGINDHHAVYYPVNGLLSERGQWFRTDFSYDPRDLPR